MAAAKAAHSSGRLEESERLFRRLAFEDEKDTEARMFLGIVVAKAGRDAEAEQILQGVLREKADAFEALFWLSVLLRRGGRLEEALPLARRAASLQPQSATALNNLGVCEMEARNLEPAISAFARSSQLKPNDATVLYNLATCLGLIGRDEDALQVLQRAAAIAPNSLDVRVMVAKTLLNLNELNGAVEVGRSALALNEGSAAAHRVLAMALMHQGRSAQARTHVERALAIEPEDASAFATLGTILQSSGDIEGSNDALRRSIELDPEQGHAYFTLVHNRRLISNDRELLERMESLAERGILHPKEQSSLLYGLGKGFEDLGEYERAMGHYDEANRLARHLKFADAPFDAKQAAASTDLKIRRYTRAFLARATPEGLKSDAPIFIVGMMRSGTTLLEQILSSHPDVAAGGEIEFWTSRGLECIGPNGEPDLVKLRILAREYLQILKGIGPGSAHVTDKMPANYLSLGLIHAALPNAKIVHMIRNPVDTAISIYATPNRARIDYAHDKAAIVAAYKQYLRLMEHWRQVLPPERLLEVQYEDLVQDRENVSRKVAAFCGLEWSDALLRPESNERSVVTPSVWQVRQPVYRTSVERWKRFEPWLGPFRELLA